MADYIKDEDGLNEEDKSYIDCILGGTKPLEAYVTHITYPEDMDEYQIEVASREYHKTMAGKIAKRRLALKKEGLLESMERTTCTEYELLFVREYLMRAGEHDRIVNAYSEIYATTGLTRLGIYTRAMKLLNKKSVKLALDEYRKNMEEEFNYSLGEYIRELNENRDKARIMGQISAMNTATLEKGKLFGYSDKNALGSKNNPITIKEKTIEDVIAEINQAKQANQMSATPQVTEE